MELNKGLYRVKYRDKKYELYNGVETFKIPDVSSLEVNFVTGLLQSMKKVTSTTLKIKEYEGCYDIVIHQDTKIHNSKGVTHTQDGIIRKSL